MTIAPNDFPDDVNDPLFPKYIKEQVHPPIHAYEHTPGHTYICVWERERELLMFESERQNEGKNKRFVYACIYIEGERQTDRQTEKEKDVRVWVLI